MNHTTKAQRLNKRYEAIWETYKKQGQRKRKALSENGLTCTCNACDRIIWEGETFNNEMGYCLECLGEA